MSTVSKKADSAQSEKPALKTNTIGFANKHESLLVFPDSVHSAEDIVDALALKPYKAVFLNLGGTMGFDSAIQPKLTQLFSRGIASAALEANALIIDGGMPNGTMELMGKGVADRSYKSQLVGIAPADKVTQQGDMITNAYLDPNHSHFILTEGGDWRSEPIINEVIENLIRRPGKLDNRDIERKVPGLAIVTGGNDNTKEMLLQAVRQKLSIIVVAGSGGFADELAAANKASDTPPEDPAMAEIMADGKLFFHDLAKSPTDIRTLISSSLGVDKVLMQAWETFADYDLNANLQQKRFDKFQQSIIVIGVVGTFLAIVQQLIKPAADATNVSSALTGTVNTLYVILIIIPIALTILITITNRFKQGNKWLLLRAAAESIKREIFRYRTRTNDYAPPKPADPNVVTDPSSVVAIITPEQQLAKKVEDITTRVMRTEVNSSYLIPYNKELGFPPDMYGAIGGDDGFALLDPEKYINVRLTDQHNYFRKKSVKLGKQLSTFSIAIFVIGGIGTFLAAMHQPVWIALTTTIVAGLGTYLGYRQTENTLTKYNQTATNLTNIKAWWNALPPDQQLVQDNVNVLVDHTEQVLQVELDGWIQQMQNALAELRKNQDTKTEAEENKSPEDKAKKQQQADGAGGADEAPADLAKEPAEPGAEAAPKAAADPAATPTGEAEAPVEGHAESPEAETGGAGGVTSASDADVTAITTEDALPTTGAHEEPDATTVTATDTPAAEAGTSEPTAAVPEKDPSSAEADDPVTADDLDAATSTVESIKSDAEKVNGTSSIHVQPPPVTNGDAVALAEPEVSKKTTVVSPNGKK